MPSIEAVQALKADAATWARWCEDRPGERIDLSGAELAGCDLTRRTFPRCNLAGARLEHANLDGAVFEGCTLGGANLTDASLIGCTFAAGTTIKGSRLDRAVMRDAEFSDSRLYSMTAVGCVIEDVRMTGCVLQDLTMEDCNLTGFRLTGCIVRRWRVSTGTLHGCEFTRECRLEDLTFTGVTVTRCEFTRDCRLEDLTFTGVTVTRCEFSDAIINQWQLTGGALESTSITDSRVRGFSVAQADVRGLDLSGTTITGGAATDWGLANAVLMRTAFASCTWPEKFITLHWWGGFTTHPALMEQPVQDVSGVPPAIRRDIADAQFLKAKRDAAGRPIRILYHLWGLTSAYGQSVPRLTIWAVGLVIAHALGVLAAQHQLAGQHAPHARVILNAFDSLGTAFIGLGGQPPNGASALVSGLYLSARFFGFLVLGIWVSIAANNISKLGQ